MKTVDVSDEAYERIMRDSRGASFDAMIWIMIRDYESSKKMGNDMMGALLAAATSNTKEEFKEKLERLKMGRREDFPT
jgi:predicted CopG family antitoxin